MSDSALYELTDVRHRISEQFSLEIDSLKIWAGETLCLVGPTGAGKSSLLNLLTGLVGLTSGQISYRGTRLPFELSELALQRQITTAHQSPMILSETVRANMEYGLRVRGISNSDQRAATMLDRLGMAALVHQDARTLSGGQKQLLAIGRALVVEPAVLLLDEPTSHLDPAHVARVESLIHEHQQRTGMTIVWVTHNLFQAKRVASRVGLLLDGRLIEVAPTRAFFDSPQSPSTSAFIHGKMVY